ncbi:tRNA uridine-5-carboxymethylaminomethyl(34) synthesis GTPase MnmE [Candidatus Dependentiae bacterium]|nr:tRNA uridine-5-carboxymethylaminomethyl(34) synthesis GTPase MnmE [Candidatus Dependentiae bacterium]
MSFVARPGVLLSQDQESIIACCTPQGSGAIALLRLSGVDSFEIVTHISKLPGNKKIYQQKTHTIQYGWIVDTNGTTIDQVLFFLMRGPKTFTGQDTIEISCHNNPFIIEAIIQEAIKNGARLAQNGEFTKRSVLNGKIDLVQAEAINELIHAHTQQALKQSLAQLEGSLSGWLHTIENNLIKALALSEASFEFIDEEDLTFENQILQLLSDVLTHIKDIKKTFDQQQHIRNGIRIALIGAVNAGKSSLFNTLLSQERAIVTNIAGTTRDAIEAGIYRSGNYWTLVDTAGLRQTDDVVEELGIKKSFEQAHLADIILLVSDSLSQLYTEQKKIYTELLEKYRSKIICVNTKYDMQKYINDKKEEHSITVSSKTGHNITLLEQKIEKKIMQLLKRSESSFLLNKRQFNILLGLEKKLEKITPMLKENIQYELISYHLNDAISHINQLTGKSISEKGMDAVFREFCVGK